MIGGTTLDQLLTADPHNVVRLILPGRLAPDEEEGGDVNERAADRLHAWLDAGILAPDPEPSFYIYEQRYRDMAEGALRRPDRGVPGGRAPGWVQRGLIALVKVGSPRESGIVPHEDVMPGPVRDRRDLMAATRANLEPIFLVYEGGRASAATAITDRAAGQEPPLATAVTRDGITHRLWRLADPAEIAAITADLAPRSALIADGHHRYAAYRELRRRMHSRGHGSGPWDYGLAFLVDADAYPPQLGAIHRVIPGLEIDHAAKLAARAFSVHPVHAAGLDQALDCLAKAGRGGPAFLLASPGPAFPGPDLQGPAAPADASAAMRYLLLTDPDAGLLDAAMPADASPGWRRLDAAVFQRLLLATAWGIEDNERDVVVFHDAAEAIAATAATRGTAVIMNPVPFGAVRDLARGGERVPRKSTSFGPKPRSGLVLRTFHEEGGSGAGWKGR